MGLFQRSSECPGLGLGPRGMLKTFKGFLYLGRDPASSTAALRLPMSLPVPVPLRCGSSLLCVTLAQACQLGDGASLSKVIFLNDTFMVEEH